jgi:hypothetical protein
MWFYVQTWPSSTARKTDRAGFTSWVSTKGGVIALIERIEVG